MAKVRKDNKGRNLRPGETQRADGSYMYVYKLGTKKKYLYDSDLASLRVKEKQINKDKDDGIRTQEAMKLTLNDSHEVLLQHSQPEYKEQSLHPHRILNPLVSLCCFPPI